MPEVLSFLMGSVATVLSWQAYRIGRRLLPYFTPPRWISTPWSEHLVVLAGCTDGIGLEFAAQIASKNARIIAIARNASKLSELKRRFPGTITVEIDFSTQTPGRTDQQTILNAIKQQIAIQDHKVIGVVNSVGVAHFSAYSRLSHSDILKIHHTNIHSLHFLLRLAQLLENSNALAPRPFFINISSALANHPRRYTTVYAASKAYLSNLLAGVRLEATRMTFLDIKPWFVRTKMIGYQKSWDSVGPETIAEGAFRVLGKRTECNGCWQHELMDQFEWLLRPQMSTRNEENMERVLRMEALRKKRNQKE